MKERFLEFIAKQRDVISVGGNKVHSLFVHSLII